jgi:hypothetical protein
MARSKVKCPVDPETREWIESRMAWLKAQFGPSELGTRPLVLPIAEFFPDSYDGSEPTVRTLFERVCGYMGVRPDQVDVSLYSEDVPIQEGDLVPGTGGLYEEGDGRFRIWLNTSNLDDPGALVATMAHEIGHVLLLGHRRISPDEPDHEPLTDLLTVFLGLGVITANSVVHENSWFDGGMTGWTIGRRGYLTMPMYGYALAVFARDRSEDRPAWARLLRPDVRHAFDQGQRYLAADESMRLETTASAPRSGVAAGSESSSAVDDEIEVPGDEATSPHHLPCSFCGTPVANPSDPPVCEDCGASIAENTRQLEAGEDARAMGLAFVSRIRFILFFGLLAVVAALIVWAKVR